MEQVDRQFEYHRLARSWPQYRWWKPLLTALLGGAFYLALTVILLLVGVVAALATSADMEQYTSAAVAIDLSDPVIFAFMLASLILMIPALALATLIMGPRPLGLLSSVAGRIRWRWLAVCTVAALVVFLASLVISVVVGFFLPEEAAAVPAPPETSTLLVLLALSILAVPFQAAAEEYVFRGFLMQAIGSWLRHPAFAILLPVPLFVAGHLYDPYGQVSVAVFAIFAGWITWRTGGLEAAIAVHTINNMTVFVLGAFGLADVNSSEGSGGGLVISVATMAVTAVVIVRLANRRGIDRTRTVTPQPALQPAYPFPGSPFPAGVHPAPAAWSHAWTGDPSQVLPGAAGQFGPYDPLQYDPLQYDPSRYGSPSDPVHRNAAPVPPAPAVPPSIPRAAPSSPPASAGPRTERSAAPSASAPAPRDGSHRSAPPRYQADRPPVTAHVAGPTAGSSPAGTRPDGVHRHPSGPGHPAGPGFPSGTPHPTGPGHPPAGSVAEQDRTQDGDAVERS